MKKALKFILQGQKVKSRVHYSLLTDVNNKPILEDGKKVLTIRLVTLADYSVLREI